jgi:4-amino-4-deoxy-L-arabinose transferase-like glycosyltransferase
VKKLLSLLGANKKTICLALIVLVLGAGLLLYRLGSLSGGLSSDELQIANTPIGWHGLYLSPAYLVLKLLRSIVFFLFGHQQLFLVRLPNALLGGLAIVAFSLLVFYWHGRRTALLASLLFATSAWTLHVSRIASYDVLYLVALPTILLFHVLLHRRESQPAWLYVAFLLWGLFTLVPGLVWLLLFEVYWQRAVIKEGWQYFSRLWQRLFFLLAWLWWLPLLAREIWASSFMEWLGLPNHLDSTSQIVKTFLGVPVHLFVRGPEYPQLWLGKAPLFDIFTLACAVIGVYFYLNRLDAQRSRTLMILAVLGLLLVGLGGAVSLSLLVPLVYVAVATGLAYLLHAWLRIFPYNPLARGLGLTLITIAVVLSCLYNLRAYFVAWPHNAVTQATFRQRP